MSAHKNSKFGRWNADEDHALRDAVKYYGDNNWTVVAIEVGKRTPEQCLHRWCSIMQIEGKNQPWLPQEDIAIKTWVEENGPTDWTSCSLKVPGRTGVQCRKRWFNMINPISTNINFSPQEDSLIFALYKKHGCKWALINQSLPNRTEYSIKSRYYMVKKRLKRRYPHLFTNNDYTMETLEPYIYLNNTYNPELICKKEDIKIEIKEENQETAFWEINDNQ